MKHLSMQQLEDLGFEVVKSYTQDKLMTQTRSNGVIKIETTWKVTGEFIRQDLTLEEINILTYIPKELKQLDKILNKN